MKKYIRGITLIALVITIIVLLILAGVTIAMLTGENGILTKATESANENRKVTAKEKIQVEVMASYETNGKLDKNLLNYNLKTNIPEITHDGKSLGENPIEELPANVELDGFAFIIDEKGNVKSAEGIVLSKSSLALQIVTNGGTVTYEEDMLTATLYNISGNIIWSTTNASVIEVLPTEDGKSATIKAKNKGSAKVVVTCSGETAECSVDVKEVIAGASASIEDIFDETGEIEGKLHVGDFINYTAGDWTEEDMNKIATSGAGVAANNSTNMPSIIFQFGGFTVGSSRDGNATPYDSSYYNYIQDISDGTQKAVTGWRLFDVEDGQIVLISAGCPEDYYQPIGTKYGYIGEYILTGNINANAGNIGLENTYKVRDWSMYVNTSYGATSAVALSKTKLDEWYSRYYNMEGADIFTKATFQKIYGTKYESLIDNYSYYWLASLGMSSTICEVNPSERVAKKSNRDQNNGVLGMRILVYLSSDIQLSETSSGTKTIVSRGTNYTYNIWNLK